MSRWTSLRWRSSWLTRRRISQRLSLHRILGRSLLWRSHQKERRSESSISSLGSSILIDLRDYVRSRRLINQTFSLTSSRSSQWRSPSERECDSETRTPYPDSLKTWLVLWMCRTWHGQIQKQLTLFMKWLTVPARLQLTNGGSVDTSEHEIRH